MLGQCVATRKHAYLQDILRWYKKDVVPTLESMQKMFDFYHNKGIDMFKLGYTLTKLAKIQVNYCKAISLHRKQQGFTGEICEDMVGGKTIVFSRKTDVDGNFIRDWTKLCKSFVRIDAAQLYPFSKCQAMPTGLYKKWELGSESGNFKPRHNKTRSFEKMIMSDFQRVRPQRKVESLYTTGTQKKTDAYTVAGFC